MPSLWFIVPAHGRRELARICLRQLRRTCDALTEHGVEATAVVVADAANLKGLAPEALGFGTVERDNQFLSRRFNDGIQLATDRRYNPRPADYVVPCGSDDWVDWRLIAEHLPAANCVVGFQAMAFVREDGRQLSAAHVDYLGGCGVRIYPRQVMEALRYRPADEDRARGCDTSILTNLRRVHGHRLHVVHGKSDSRQIVDWKTTGWNLNPYISVARWSAGTSGDPWTELAGLYPAEALAEMRAYYARARRQGRVAVPA